MRTMSWDAQGEAFSVSVSRTHAEVTMPGHAPVLLPIQTWKRILSTIEFVHGQPDEPGVDTLKYRAKSQVGHPNAGKTWSAEDDVRLEKMWGGDVLVKDMVAILGRNRGGITSRLVKLKLIAAQDAASERDRQLVRSGSSRPAEEVLGG